MNIFERLSEPFPEKAIKWRIGRKSRDGDSAFLLAYIDARHVMDRLDEVVGPDNWMDQYIEQPSGVMVCKLSVRINGEWIVKSDGAGETQVEGEKGKISDAFKRAAVKFGIGRYLYRFDEVNTWVKLGEFGKFNPPEIPEWAKPQVQQTLKMDVAEESRVPSVALEKLADLDAWGIDLLGHDEYWKRHNRLLQLSNYVFDDSAEHRDSLNNEDLKHFYGQLKEMLTNVQGGTNE